MDYGNCATKANGTVSSELWWAVAAKRIMDDLCDRSGIGDVLCEIDEETFAEIIQDVGDIIMRAHAEADWAIWAAGEH